jgi:HD-GYP domain-containing protein (c-di-GMP phosphodiesterase class II)
MGNVPTPFQTDARPSESPEHITLTLYPPASPYLSEVRGAARRAGASFIRASVRSPADIGNHLVVVDLAQARTTGRLGSRAIAISNRLDIDAYEVITPDQVRWRLDRAVRNLVERERLRRRLTTERNTVRVLNEIGYALSAQTSQNSLLDTVLTRARNVLQADGGSIYLVDTEARRVSFTCSQNDTIPFRANRLELPLDESSIAGFVASRGEPINIPDVYDLPPHTTFKPNLRFDHETGYRTRSMLVVPMKDREGQVIGVLALVNRKTTPGLPLTSFDQIRPFDDGHLLLAGSIASQAAVAIENYRLYREIRNLFDGFVGAAITAIEARDPSTGGHSHRVAALTTELARAVDQTVDGPFAHASFSDQALTELHYAAMLHDFGKVGVREELLLKANKLYPWEMSGLEARFRMAAFQVMLEERLQDASHTTLSKLHSDLHLVRSLNRPGRTPSTSERKRLELMVDEWHLRDLTAPERVITPSHVGRLCIPYGSLSDEERVEIQQHVEHTYDFLRAIPWTRDLRRVPELAYCHHEKLDGTGYPRGLKAPAIPLGARLMTICDIFDALTAGDRPYKAGMSPTRAVAILHEEADRGRIEREAVQLFERRRVWETALTKASAAR